MRRTMTAARDRLDDCELEQLADLVDMQRELADLIAHVARGLVANGATWTEIGATVGMSKQAAHEKWSQPRPGTQPTPEAHSHVVVQA